MSLPRDPDPTRLPIKVDSTSNGEFAPVPLDAVAAYARGDLLEKRRRLMNDWSAHCDRTLRSNRMPNLRSAKRN